MDSKDTNPKDIAALADSRIDMSLFPATALAVASLALTEGAIKYGPYNWRTKKVRVSVYVAALLRHLLKFFHGEDIDPVTRVPHLGSVAACAAILIDAIATDCLVDDRPVSAPMTKLLTDLAEVSKHLKTLYQTTE